MKLLATAIFAGMLAFGTAACAKEEPKKSVAVTAPTAATTATEEPKTKKVCVTQKDAKTGKDKEVCKTIKIHKKHEGIKPEDVKKTETKK